jgi:hypothetical protein
MRGVAAAVASRMSSAADLTPRMSPLDRCCVSCRQHIAQAEARFGAFFVVRSRTLTSVWWRLKRGTL